VIATKLHLELERNSKSQFDFLKTANVQPTKAGNNNSQLKSGTINLNEMSVSKDQSNDDIARQL